MRKFMIALILCFISITSYGASLKFYTGDIAPEVSINGKSYPILTFFYEYPSSSPLVKEIRSLGNGKGYMTLFDDKRPQREVTYHFTLNSIIYVYLSHGYAYITADANYSNPTDQNMIKQIYKVTTIVDNKLILTLQ